MSLEEFPIKVGAYYITPYPNSQLRKVISRTVDSKGRVRVHYVAKSLRIAGLAFQQVTWSAKPPLLSTFAKACDRQLDEDEVRRLRLHNIILRGE